jgi:hypothetical protein
MTHRHITTANGPLPYSPPLITELKRCRHGGLWEPYGSSLKCSKCGDVDIGWDPDDYDDDGNPTNDAPPRIEPMHQPDAGAEIADKVQRVRSLAPDQLLEEYLLRYDYPADRSILYAELMRRLDRPQPDDAGDAREAIPDNVSPKTCVWHRIRGLWWWTHDDDETREVVESVFDALREGGYSIRRAAPAAEAGMVAIDRETALHICDVLREANYPGTLMSLEDAIAAAPSERSDG